MKDIKNDFIRDTLSKWLSKSDSNKISYIMDNNNTLVFNYKTIEFNIIYPITYPECNDDIFMIEFKNCKNEKSISQEINSFIADKNPRFIDILKYISNKLPSLKVIDDNDIKQKDTSKEFELVKLQCKLKYGLKTMVSKLSLDVNTKKFENIKMFSDNIPGEMLIREFIDLKSKYYDNNIFSLDLVDNNIYSWNIKIKNFTNIALKKQLSELKELYNYDYIELEINFHDVLYPSYPPCVKVVRPRLNESLMYRIRNLKMLQFDYWTPARTMEVVINKLCIMLFNNMNIQIL